jgi:hypothetical protein
VLHDADSVNKLCQTVLEMIRGGIENLPAEIEVFHSSAVTLDPAFVSRLPFRVTAVTGPASDWDQALHDVLEARQPDFVALFESSGMYRGEDVVSMLGPALSGRFDAVWGSRRLSARDIEESYRLRYRHNLLLGMISAIGSHLLSLAYLFTYGRYISDTLSGARVVRYDAFRRAAVRLADKRANHLLLTALLRAKGERVMLVAGDPYRPAAVQQLQALGERVDVPVITEPGMKPPDLVAKAFDQAQKGGFGVMIIDTAGRSQLDDALMDELKAILKRVPPAETLLVVDSMIGQEALHVAEGFRDAVALTGLILTKMDGDSRGGAAISIRAVTGVPIKFLSTGEKLDALEVYDPSRLASRILGMGDVLTLVEEAERKLDKDKADKLAKKLKKGKGFDLEDLLEQFRGSRCRIGSYQFFLFSDFGKKSVQ